MSKAEKIYKMNSLSQFYITEYVNEIYSVNPEDKITDGGGGNPLIIDVTAISLFKLLTSVHVGARASFAPPASEPRISCRSSYHASNSAPHNGPTPGGYGGGRCSHSAVISPISRNSQVHGHTVHTGPEGWETGGGAEQPHVR